MPFLEISAFDPVYRRRGELSLALTQALAAAYGIKKEIISIYYFRFDREDYAHAGRHPPPAVDQRTFIKLHAFRRDIEMRRAAARALTAAVVDVAGADPESVILYFLEREKDEVAHAGQLASD
jgi:phenylpyruvate tautomerase PptA (4-oxalocrotonate tautomerase family)